MEIRQFKLFKGRNFTNFRKEMSILRSGCHLLQSKASMPMVTLLSENLVSATLSTPGMDFIQVSWGGVRRRDVCVTHYVSDWKEYDQKRQVQTAANQLDNDSVQLAFSA